VAISLPAAGDPMQASWADSVAAGVNSSLGFENASDNGKAIQLGIKVTHINTGTATAADTVTFTTTFGTSPVIATGAFNTGSARVEVRLKAVSTTAFSYDVFSTDNANVGPIDITVHWIAIG
jgi:thiazole synthase ThiGH ThiG subunit